jgi:hypothetical protein
VTAENGERRPYPSGDEARDAVIELLCDEWPYEVDYREWDDRCALVRAQGATTLVTPSPRGWNRTAGVCRDSQRVRTNRGDTHTMNHQQDASDWTMILLRLVGRTRRETARALDTTRSWADTIRAASYGEDKGGNRWEIDPVTLEIHPMPNDPTGERVVAPDDVAQLHDRLYRLYRQIRSTASEIENILDQASPDPAKHPRKPDDQVSEDRWCTSCMQDRGRLEPVAVHSDGRVRYKGLCRWCHDFITDHGRRPTPSLIAKHHTPYVNVTPTDIDRALGRTKKATA